MSITTRQRKYIQEQSGGCCEYCRVKQGNQFARFQIDHIIPLKHNGTDSTENLCFSCADCNSYKGPNVAALDPLTGNATRLYNPREQEWKNHFQINLNAKLKGLTPEGRTTIEVLRINLSARILQRQMAMKLDEYPCEMPGV